MTQVRQINLMNDSMITYLKKIGANTQRNEIIKQILKDEACFFKLDKEDAYIILEDVGVSKSKIDYVYSRLISNENFFNLASLGKIKENDESLKIKYNSYNPEDLFKKAESSTNLQKEKNIVIKQEKTIFDKIIDKIKVIFKIKFKK